MAMIQSYNQEVDQSLKKNPPPENVNEISIPQQVFPETKISEFQKSMQTEFKKCFPDYQSSKINTTKDIVDYFEKQFLVEKKSIDIENFHFKLKSGEERRVHLTLSNRPNINREMKIFKVDADGLPEKIPGTENEIKNPTPTQIQKSISMGNVYFHQIKEVIIYKNGARSFIDWINDEPHEFQFLNPTHTFSCSTDSCHCL